MGNVFSYLKWRGDLSFKDSRMNEVDALLFSLFNYTNIDFNGRETLKKVAIRILKKIRTMDISDVKKISEFESRMTTLFVEACKTKRFRNILLIDKEENIDYIREMQFQASTYLIDKNTIVVSFKGTDESLLGFKEDFNMSLNKPVTGQIEASKYLNRILEEYNHPNVYVVGHSKGGNFAVYSASHAIKSERKRLKLVYNFDGPGFTEEFLKFDGYEKTIPIIKKYVPKDAFVGGLMQDRENITVIDAQGRSGFDQHNGLSWKVIGNSFVQLEKKSNKSIYIERAMNNWISEIQYEDRKKVIDKLYNILTKSMSIYDVKELQKNKMKFMYYIFQNMKDLDEDEKKLLHEIFIKFIKSGSNFGAISDKS